MTLINNLIRLAKSTPTPPELTINDSQVGAVVAHIVACCSEPISYRLVERQLRLGRVTLYKIPIRVIGQKAPVPE